VSLATLHEHRRLWAEKPVLREIYAEWFEAILAQLPDRGRVAEIGAGPGFLAEHVSRTRPALRWTSSDLLCAPWNDLGADAERLPLRTATLDGVAGLDFLHHLARPAAFFVEAGRVLVRGGVLAAVEPWVTPVSYPVYRFLHQEGCRLGLDPWNPFPPAAGRRKQAFDGDAAVVYRLVRNTPEQRWRAFGFEPPRTAVLNGFAYLLSLGFRRASLLPRRAIPALLGLDRGLRWAAPWLGFRVLVVWRRL
jgi:SAM-dependent methyltransferase